jgi:hypothetical protein
MPDSIRTPGYAHASAVARIVARERAGSPMGRRATDSLGVLLGKYAPSPPDRQATGRTDRRNSNGA